MDRFGIGYVAALILLLFAFSLLWPPVSGPGETSAPRAHSRHSLAGSPSQLAAPAGSPFAATTVAVLSADGRSYRILVGRDAAGRTWSAAFAVGD